MLIEAGANIDEADQKGADPEMLASKIGRRKSVDLIKSKRASLNTVKAAVRMGMVANAANAAAE